MASVNGFMETLIVALQEMLGSLIGNFLALLGILIFLIAGYFVGWIFKKIVIKLVESVRLDDWLEEQNLASAIGGTTISALIGSLVKWSIVALFLTQAVNTFQLTTFQVALETLVLTLLPNVIVAAVIGILGLIIGRYVRNLIEVSMTRFRKIIGFGAELLVIYMAVVIALEQIKIPTEILIKAFEIGFGGFVLAIVVAVGLAFGLASIDDAKIVLKDLKKSKPK